MRSRGRAARAGAIALVAAAVSSGVAPLRAQDGTRSVHPRTPLVAAAARLAGAITVDGNLTDPAWSAATPITRFTQSQPHEGQPATQRTEVRVLYDDEALYIGARVFDSLGAEGVRAPLARRDQLLDANGSSGTFDFRTTDKLVVLLDPYHNHIDRAWFEVSPAGVKGDQFNGDPSWDPVWQSATRIDSLGWTAELRIPFSQLRFSRDSAQTWGMQLWRYDDRTNERDMWAFWRADESGGPAFYGHLTGLVIGRQPRQFELLPYVLAEEQYKYAPSADPYHAPSGSSSSAGMDLKYLLTSNLTLDATVHPDFGQVEVDPATINLSAFETHYAEKRPFFVAGSNAFDFGGFECYFCNNVAGLDLFYSRRIGRTPQLDGYIDDRAAFGDTPRTTAILGAVKIAGRTDGGVSVGMLDAITNRETARYVASPGGPGIAQQVEPLANYFVGRVKKELRDGATTVGGVFTSTARQLSDTVLSDRLHRHAEAAGLDFSHTWSGHTYRWTGSLALSSVAGSSAALDFTERSSAHYFQRPDRRVTTDGLFAARYDSTATALQGYGFYTRLAKDNGDWIWETAQNWRSPGFEVNDLSFMSRADYKWMNANVGRQWTTPSSWFRNMVVLGGGQQQFNYDGDRTDQQAQVDVNMELLNYWKLSTYAVHHPAAYDDRLTRGGPVVRRGGWDYRQVQVSTDPRGAAVFDLLVGGGSGIGSGTHFMQIAPGVAIKPSSSVVVSLTPSFGIDEDAAQYVTTKEDSTATAFSGNRYVFAFLHTQTWSLDTRIDWTFTPNLTLQLYAQPYFSTGDYSSFREFAAPRTLRKVIYGRDAGTIVRTPATTTAAAAYTVDPDAGGPAPSFSFADPNFAYRSLIGNAVLRWEYRPGSTVYVVWTQNRAGTAGVGDFDFSRDRRKLFADRPTNSFQIKANFWIGR